MDGGRTYGRQALIQLERRRYALVGVVKHVLPDEAGEVAAALHGGNARERPPGTGANGRLWVNLVRHAQVADPAAVPTRNQGTGVLTAGAITGEPQRPRKPVGSRIWTSRD